MTVAADPRQALGQIATALQAGDIDQAAKLSQRAREAGVEHPLPLSVLAHAAQQAGRFDDAVGYLARAIEIDPDPMLYTRLGGCLDAARRPREALQAFDAALARAPDLAAALDGKARVVRANGQPDEARALFEAALKADPQFLAAMIGLASLSAEAGDWPAARAGAERALTLQPGFPEALWLMAQAALAEGDAPGAEARLKTLLADTRLTPFQLADTRLQLADALHAQEKWGDAFKAYVAGKASLHRLYAQRAGSRESETARAQRLTAWVEKADPAALAPVAGPDEGEAAGHVFILGFPRSGTTLLEQVLASHPEVTALEERPTLAAHVAEFLADPAGLTRLSGLTEADAGNWRRLYWETVRASGVEAAGRVFVDKQPGGTINLPLIARLFPRAKILFAVRDPRDVVLSCLRRNFQLNALSYEFTTLEGTVRCYGAMMGLAEACRARMALDWLDVRHEALVADFDAVSREVASFLGLKWTPTLADFAKTAQARTVRTPSAAQVRAGLTDTGVGRWRDYRKPLGPVLPTLKAWVDRYDYPAT